MITSPRNRRVVEAARLQRSRERARTGLTLLEGPHLLAEARDVAVREVFALPEDREAARRAGELGAELVRVGRRPLDRLAPTEHPRGPVAVMEIPAGRRAEGPRLLVLWGLGDPGNVGTLIRSAAAFGFEVLVGPGTADPWAPKVLRAGAGGHFRTVVEARRRIALEELRGAGYRVVATVVERGRAPWETDLSGRLALLVGDEARGLPEEAAAGADLRVTIPMPGGTESLNAAMAGTLLLYEALRQGGTG